ncbi:MOSC domain-containing protein [Falsiroseomonas sp. HW251]|uniref:MOSC domain-containing protein n=1 Tax=Falsiroseomonas sp. HW251 TaxID=3390998 RepID=UPI003D31A054
MSVRVLAVSSHPTHAFSKPIRLSIRLLPGLGVAGDAHCGATVKHRSRVRRDPTQPNLRQLHLLHAELLDELATKGFAVRPGDIGENVLTSGLDLLALPRGTRLRLGATALVGITGLRNPCSQLDGFAPGLMAATLDRAVDGSLIRKAGVMAVILESGDVAPGDPIAVELPPTPHEPLLPV